MQGRIAAVEILKSPCARGSMLKKVKAKASRFSMHARRQHEGMQYFDGEIDKLIRADCRFRTE